MLIISKAMYAHKNTVFLRVSEAEHALSIGVLYINAHAYYVFRSEKFILVLRQSIEYIAYGTTVIS